MGRATIAKIKNENLQNETWSQQVWSQERLFCFHLLSFRINYTNVPRVLECSQIAIKPP
jgi:hypothetical protein